MFFLLICHSAGHAQALQSPPSIPVLVVTLDGARLKDADPANNTVTRQAIMDSMTASGANLVLFRAAIRASSENADITDQVVARIMGAANFATTKAFAPRLEVLDMAAAKKFGKTEDETAINKAAEAWMRDTGANLVLDSAAVVVSGSTALDVTGNVISTITHTPVETRAQPLEGRMVLMGRITLMQNSKVGQDIFRQAAAYAEAAEQELGPRNAALQETGKTLQDALSTLSPDEKARRLDAFKKEAAAIQALALSKDAQIREGVEVARHSVEEALGPLLSEAMKDRGADLVLDSAAVFTAPPGLDITEQVVERLDMQLGHMPVVLNQKPAGQEVK
ncbi:MAG TPA: OmpH family outer membrane protein [Rhizomicrobium sp.]|nr:OmpH family outer membrane protein [Rhizomicrobium sp.]